MRFVPTVSFWPWKDSQRGCVPIGFRTKPAIGLDLTWFKILVLLHLPLASTLTRKCAKDQPVFGVCGGERRKGKSSKPSSLGVGSLMQAHPARPVKSMRAKKQLKEDSLVFLRDGRESRLPAEKLLLIFDILNMR